MSSYVTPKKNTEFIFYVGLFSQANTKVLQSNPTLASGDVRVSIDGGAFANLTTLPTVAPASGKAVKVTLSASEMNGDNITVLFSDAAGDEWCDLIVNIQTTAQQVDDLALASDMAIGFTESLLGVVLSSGKIGETGNDITHIHLASLDYADDELNDYLLVIYDASDGDYYSRWIEDWVNSSGLATVAALPFTPQGGVDNYWLHAVRRDSGLTASEVNAEVDTALADIHLDHLLATTYDPTSKPGASDALLNELIGSDGGVSQFTANALENAPSGSGATAQDVWEYATRTLTQSAASVAAAVNGDRITVYRGTRWSITLTGLGNISALDRIYFSVKKAWRDSEDNAMVRLRNGSNGLLRINKAAATSASAGTLTINDAVTGSITITIAAPETDAVVPDTYDYDIKGIDTDGDPVTMLAYGERQFIIKGDITQAIS